MKKLLLLPIIGVAFSCGMSPEEKLIADHEQTVLDSKIDLSIKFIETKKLGDLYYKDSLPDLETHLSTKSAEKIAQLRERYSYGDDSASVEPYVQLYQTDYKETFLEPVFLKINELKEKGDQKAGELWQAHYKMKNPFLDGVMQEVTNQYVLSPDATALIRKVEK